MNCRLCSVELDNKNSCEAHIFPRGLLKDMSAEEYGRLLIVGTDMERKKHAPIGSYDKDILCRSCDNKLGQYDEYALRFINDSKLVPHSSGRFWLVSGVDQAKLKLFCMSYLWRASITDRKEFAGISLGPKHEENVRQLLLANSPGTTDEFTTFFAKFSDEDDKLGGILFPARTRIRNLVHYEGYLPRLYKFWVKVDSQTDMLMNSVSLGGQEVVFVHNKGDFSTSIEKGILINAAHSSQ